MSKKADEIAALREQVKVLQAEVAALKAVPWWQQQGGGVATWPAPCTCGSTAGCRAHLWPRQGSVWVTAQDMCAGAAPVPQSFVIDTASANPFVFEMPVSTFGAAGCAPAQTFMVNTGA